MSGKENMITGIIISIGVITVVIAYIIGRVQGIPEIPCQHHWESYPYNCKCYLCSPHDYISRTEIEIREKQAYQKGRYEGILETKSDIRFTRFISMSDQEKFLKRFNECVKPIEELKKDLESGKF